MQINKHGKRMKENGNVPRLAATAHETFITSQIVPVQPGAQLHSN